MRLNKYLSKSGVASRRKSDELIRMATTEVNGRLCLDPSYQVKEHDIVKYGGSKISVINETIIIMLNKPKNYISTVIDTHGRKTVMDLIPDNLKVKPVGRLDKNTTGLLLLTNDGNMHQYLTHPKNKVPKDYEVEIEGYLNPEHSRKIEKGIYIGNKEYGKAKIIKQVTSKGRAMVIMRLTQGKKREIRRIFHRIKIKIINLKRIRFCKLSLGNLEIGRYIFLNKKQKKFLM